MMIRERAALAALVFSALAVGTAPAAIAAAPAKPAHICYSRAEHAAEQVLRLHAEMMVVGLMCQTIMPEKNPFGQYQEFTVRNRTAVSQAEATMIGHFRRAGKGNATQSFDTYRTEVANEISRRAAFIGTANYCNTFVERVQNAAKLAPEDVRAFTSDEKTAGIMLISVRPLCDVQVVSQPEGPAPAAPAAKAATNAKPAKPVVKQKVAAKN